MYTMLEAFLPAGSLEKEEVDKITVHLVILKKKIYVYVHVLTYALIDQQT